MISSRRHIITRCQWDTRFDKKELGAALQGRLSSWSHLKMPGEMEAIFDKLCPPGQVWKIDSLTLDLGPISLDELEPGLSQRLRRQLAKQLADLLLHRDEGSNAVEIVDEDTLQIELLSYFFQYGLIPWSYKDLDSSINQLLAGQLQKKRQKVIAMLRKIGVTHENVRKRIAWQATEANIIKIIEGLEPNNSQQVISFSAELAAIQAKESIVQAGIADFRKNVWFWILNYLLAERGSIFNKVAFVRSNLQQMAAHYHISYNELIGMIGQAIEKVQEHNSIREDILITLNILVGESSGDDIKNKKNQPDTDIRTALESYFLGKIMPGREYSITELNDMVLNIAGNKEPGFRQQLLSFGNREELLAEKLSVLNDNSLEAIFSSLISDNLIISKTDIHYLYNICRQLKVEERFLWEAAIKFITGNKGTSLTRKNFLDQLVTALGSRDRVSKIEVLERLLCADVPPGDKTLSSLTVFTDLSIIFAAEISADNRAVTIKRFRELLDMLGQQVRRNAIEKPVFIALRKPVVQYIRLNPAAAFKALVAYRHKRTLKKLLPYLLDELLTNLLMRNAKNEAAEILLSLNDVLQKAGASFAILIEWAVAQVGLVTILCEPTSNAKADLERLLEKIALLVSGQQLGQFFELLKQWLGNSKLPGNIITPEFIIRLKQKLMPVQKQLLLQQVGALLQKAGNEYPVSRLLYANFEERHFAALRKQGDKEGTAILNYLVKDGVNLLAALVKKYVLLLKDNPLRLTENKIAALLKELYWKCILDTGYHNGNTGALRKLFEGVVYTAFNIPGTETGQTLGGISNVILLLNGQQITRAGLFLLIEQSIRKAPDTVTFNGQIVCLDEVISIGLETKPAELLRIIKNITISEKRVEALNKAIPFDQFCLLIANGGAGNINDAITSVRMLYALADHITSGRISQKLLYSYWRAVWAVIRTNNLKPADMQSLVAETMYQLAAEKHVSSDFILSEIGKLSFQFTHTLKAAFAGYNSVFAVLLTSKTAKLSRELRKIKQKGALYNLSYHIITRKQVPLWFFYADEQKLADTLNEIVVHDPVNLLLVLKHEMITEQQMTWLHNTLNFPALINSITALNQNRHVVLNDLGQLYKMMGKISVPGVSAREMQHMLFRKLLLAWTTNNWAAISAECLWNELVWYVCVKRSGSKKQFQYAAGKIVPLLPLSLQLGFKGLKEQEKNAAVTQPAIAKHAKNILPTGRTASQAKEGIVIKNAGLVLVNNYVPVLLERLGHVKDKKFIHTEAREHAIHHLQYVVTGLKSTEEYLLPLNKVMCGLQLDHPVDNQVDISDEHHDIVEGLIKAMIAHWPTIGEHTVNGFRGNWLVRDGMLTELDDKWELTVEKRAYDVLLNKSPFSFSIIKYPWMDKPIHVTWSY